MIHEKILSEKSILKLIESKKHLRIGQKINVRFSSFPNGPMHLGHAYTSIYNSINSYLNDGKFYFILDDTDPKKIDRRVYDWLIEDLEWLGIIPDTIFYTSDYIEEIYETVKKLIEENKAYLCNCPFKFFLFNWDDIPGKCNERLRDFLRNTFDIDWIITAKIEKSDDNRIINLSDEKNLLSLRLNNQKTMVILTKDDKNYRFIVEAEKDKLKIYYKLQSECIHDKNSKQENIELFNSLMNLDAIDYTVKLRWPLEKDKYNIEEPFSSRVILRYVKEVHPLRHEKKIWPTMNFAVAFMDRHIGTTHIFRGPEHVKNSEKQKYIHEIIKSQMINYSCGPKISSEYGIYRTSMIKNAIDKGLLEGFDDPRVFTIRAFKRRGFSPQAIWSYILSLKTVENYEIEYSEDILGSENRKYLDLANTSYSRCFFIMTPKKMKYIKGNFESQIYISQFDLAKLNNDVAVLHGEGVCKINANSIIYDGNYRVKGVPHLYWLSANGDLMKANLKSGYINNFSSLICKNDIKNLKGLVLKLQTTQDTLFQYLKEHFSIETLRLIDEYDASNSRTHPKIQTALVNEFNQLIQGDCLFNEPYFKNIFLNDETLQLISQNLRDGDLIRLNRLLLEKAYPNDISKSQKNIPFFVQGLMKNQRYNINDIIFINDMGYCRVDSINPLNLIFSHT